MGAPMIVAFVIALALGIGAAVLIVRQYPSDQGKFTDVAFGAFISIVTMVLILCTVNYLVLLASIG